MAAVVDQNLDLLDIPYDFKLAMLATGSNSRDIFNYVGVEWLEAMIRYGRLASDGAVLDIGCGCGRMAGPLMLYLNKKGSFVGFEPVAKAVAHARANLQQANFRFEHVDLKHYLYNPDGKVEAANYRFPCDDESIDVSIAGSVFTHLELNTANHYLCETRRVLRPGGRALYSLFSLMEGMKVAEGKVTQPLGAPAGDGMFRFLNRGNGVYTHCDEHGNPANHFVPDPIGDPVAFDHEAFIGMAEKAGLMVENTLPGSWCRKEYLHGYQDMFVLRRPV
jgi:SAM-dependent methyltransferase